MIITPGNTLIVQRQFVIDAPQQRVWDLLARVIYQCLPLEKMDIVNERTFNAEVRWNLAFIGLTFHLKGEFIDISPPNFLSCALSMKRGLIQLGLKVAFTLRPVNHHKTEVVCRVEEGKGIRKLVRWVMRKPEQRFAGNVFNSMRVRLEQLC